MLVAARDVHVVLSDGEPTWHDVGRWIADADAVDLRLLDRCAGPTLDLGCGPGRLAAALAGRGVPALGVDVSARGAGPGHARAARPRCAATSSPAAG